MAELLRFHTIRPPERLNSSVNYKVDTQKVTPDDTLIVNITDEKSDYARTFYFNGKDVASKDSIHFKVTKIIEGIDLEWSGAKPTLIPEPVIIDLKPEWFKMGYYVYVVAMKFKKENYFYIGMTGDRKHKTARSPFYRMSGHFSLLESSTQNQVIKGIRRNFEVGTDIEKILGEMKFTYYAYMITPFDKADTSNHDANRKHAESIESSLIHKMKDGFGSQFVFNKNQSTKNFNKVDAIAQELMIDVKQRIKSKVSN